MKFSIKDFFRKCDHIHWKLRYGDEILNAKLIFCAAKIISKYFI